MNKELICAIKHGLIKQGLSAAAASKIATGKKDAIALILRGHDPSFSRVKKIAKALDLEFYIGPSREAKNLNKKGNHSEKNVSLEILEKISEISEGASRCEKEIFGLQEIAKKILGFYKEKRPPNPKENDYSLGKVNNDNATTLLPYPSARPVDVVELACAAGGGAEVLSEEVIGRLWFRRAWLDEHGLDATQCAVLGVHGESMQPTLADGAKILVNRAARRRQSGRIYVIRADGLIVKRLARTGKVWRLISDNSAWPNITMPAQAEIIGQVVWTARTL